MGIFSYILLGFILFVFLRQHQSRVENLIKTLKHGEELWVLTRVAQVLCQERWEDVHAVETAAGYHIHELR